MLWIRMSIAFLLPAISAAQTNSLELQMVSFFGGGGNDSAAAVAYDSVGDLWLCGDVSGPGFPQPAGEPPIELPGSGDIFVAHLAVAEDDAGERSYNLVQTLIVGGLGQDSCGDIVVAPGDRIYIGGITQSPDFPALATEIQGDFDLFLAELAPAAALESSPANQSSGRRVVANARTYGGASAEEFRDLAIAADGEEFTLFLGGHTLGDAPLGPGRAPHAGAGLRDLLILRVDESLELEAGVAMGGTADEFFGDLSVSDGVGRFVASSGSPTFEGLPNPGTGQSALSGSFDAGTLAVTAQFHPTPDGNEQFILQRHAWAAARQAEGAQGAGFGPVLLGFGTASDSELRSTAVVIDLATDEILLAEDNTSARVFRTDAAGSIQYGFIGPTHGIGLCEHATDGQVVCSPSTLTPAEGTSLFLNGIATGDAGVTAIAGSASGTLIPTAGAPQAMFGGVRDGFVLEYRRPALLALVNAAFNGDVGPGELVTAFGNRIGPLKSSFAVSQIAGGALETQVENIEVRIERESGEIVVPPLLNASFMQTTFELPPSLEPGERIGVRIRNGAQVSNPYWLTLAEPGIAPFLFNGTEAVVQHASTNAIATEGNPLRPGDVAVLWANSGIERTPACPGEGTLAAADGNPLHRLARPETRAVRLRAVTETRETLFSAPALFEGSPPGQLCNSVLQVNFTLADEAQWSEPGVQAALAASAALRSSNPDVFAALLTEATWLPVLDPVSGETVPVFVTLL